jgi:hypothetical protein
MVGLFYYSIIVRSSFYYCYGTPIHYLITIINLVKNLYTKVISFWRIAIYNVCGHILC